MPATPVSVHLASIGRDFGSYTALHDIDLHIPAGQFTSLLGPSGCGKTTTLRLIAGFDSPDRGRIHVGGKDVTDLPPNRRNLGMVFQDYALFPHMTVAENIGFGLRMAGISRSEIATRVQRMLDMIHLSAHGDRLPDQLSGGQRQRVAIARSIVTEPSVLLLDEPMGALDKNLRQSMQAELRQIQQNLQITTILVTHDQDEALTMSDRIVVMQGGHIRQEGSPQDVYLRPTSDFVANFLGISNNLPARILGAAGGTEAEVALFPGTTATQITRASTHGRWLTGDIILGIRPERVNLSEASPAPPVPSVVLPVSVTGHVFRGAYHDYTLSPGDGLPTLSCFEQARQDETEPRWKTGQTIWASWPAGAQSIFESNS